ncbi:hypothetical protein [Desulfurivibrio dismutans]|uniref:hypothetical protein n=1 Tax=Desulfurivibrio dismutans TaxID=1398908 RepID=UPI0023DA4CDD|nr:hypothetical protein [Desulfurivibrio alkaliphilus]MDF1614093.1 hypothetical protein [Desulfurivibrio alkaliphilus]
MALKPLGVVKTIVEAAGMGISYVYDDLIFLEHNSFLLQFTDNEREITVHVNREADEAVVQGDIARLQESALDHAMQLTRGGRYTLVPEGEDSLRIEFSD